MPRLLPLQAVRFDTPENRDISTLIAPPYDVLDEVPKQTMLARDPHNIVAIDLPVTPPKTVGPDAAYQTAGDLYRQWLLEGTLRRDKAPGVYAYEQVYEVGVRSLRRRGFFTALATEDFNRPHGGIFRHEMTIQGGIDDRYKLMEASAAQFSPVFGIFSDRDATAAGLLRDICEGREPDSSGVTAHDAVEHRLWQVTDASTLDLLVNYFEKTDVFIADGHHRYTTALAFGRNHPEMPGAGSCLFVLVAAEDEGMIVLPTHRIITGMHRFGIDRMMEAADRLDASIGLQIQATQLGHEALADLATDLPDRGHHAMGLYHHGSGRLFTLSFTNPDPLASRMPDKPQVWRTLDVAILQHLVVERLLAPVFAQNGLPLGYKYTADMEQVRELADAQEDRLGVIMQPTPLEAVMEVSRANEVMPPKSTFFYPKLATGMVIHPLD